MSTLCFTGMDRAEEARLKAMFSDANEWLGGQWALVPEAQAQVLIVDLESIYGHMTWLKVHNGSKYVIAITTRTESEAEHVLLRPVTVESLVTALSEVNRKPVSASAPAAMPTRDPAAQAPHMDVQVPRAQDAQERPPHMDVKEKPQQVDVQEQQVPPVRYEQPPALAPIEPVAIVQATPSPPPPRQVHAPARARDPVLWDYLQAGGLSSPSRLELDGAPPLIIDPRTDTYIGGQSLKPYIPYFELGTMKADRWQALSGADLNTHLSTASTAHPLSRLRWLHSLVQGRGELAPGYDPSDKFRLSKWPKTEREFPKHMRIATAMMQLPGTPAEIAAKSDVALADVNDFINASLDSGFAELVNTPPATPDPGAKAGGLFSRFRTPRNG